MNRKKYWLNARRWISGARVIQEQWKSFETKKKNFKSQIHRVSNSNDNKSSKYDFLYFHFYGEYSSKFSTITRGFLISHSKVNLFALESLVGDICQYVIQLVNTQWDCLKHLIT